VRLLRQPLFRSETKSIRAPVAQFLCSGHEEAVEAESDTSQGCDGGK